MNKLIPIFERLLSLLVVFLLLAGTVVWSGSLFGRRIGASTGEAAVATVVPQPDADQMVEMGLSGEQLAVYDSAAWSVTNSDGDMIGAVLATAPYSEDVAGFAGATPLYIYIDTDSIVRGIASGENMESPAFYRRATEEVFTQLVGKHAGDILARPVDVATGATYSSNSLISNVKYTLQTRAAAVANKQNTPAIGWTRTLAVVLVLAFGILVAWKWRGVKWLRIVVLVLNVCVTGFWCGQYLSLALVRGWIQNGLAPLLYLPGLLMLLVAIVLPYLGRPHHHCQWVCPYGSLQELAWRLPVPKLKVQPVVFKLMRLTRMVVLMILLIMLWFGAGVGLLDYEPFAVFVLSTATPGVIVLAALFVVLAIFVPQPWCRCICPVGTLLELAQDNGRKHKHLPAAKPTAPTTNTLDSATTTANPPADAANAADQPHKS